MINLLFVIVIKIANIAHIYEKAIEIDPNYVKAWSNKGSILYNLGKYYEALNAVERAIEIDSRYALAWSDKLERLRKER
jgi:tetratricopeptide (TPR) repeat protein